MMNQCKVNRVDLKAPPPKSIWNLSAIIGVGTDLRSAAAGSGVADLRE
jgi:hypothetical protein